MASPLCGYGYVFANCWALKMLCCKLGKYNGPGFEGMQPGNLGKNDGGAAMGWMQKAQEHYLEP